MPTGIKHFFALYQASEVYMDTTILKPVIGGHIFLLLPLSLFLFHALLLIKTFMNALDPTGPCISKSVIFILLPSAAYILFVL